MNHPIRLLSMVALFAASALAQSSEEIIAADKAWAKAIIAIDAAALDKLLADDLVYTHSTGVVETKKIYIDTLKSGFQKYIAVTHENPKVQSFGNTAVLTSGIKMDTVREGTAQTANFRIIHVWVKRGNNWQMVAHQTTRLP